MNEMTATSKPADAYERSVGLSKAVTDLHSIQVSEGAHIAHLRDVLAEREATIKNLEAALVTSRRIGAAIGIVMIIMKVTEDGAFEILPQISQRENRKLRLVADDIVLTGTV